MIRKRPSLKTLREASAKDYKVLTKKANIAFYNSCEVTEIFLCRKADKAIFNFFTLVVFEEKPYRTFDKCFLDKLITVDADYSIGVQRYWLTTTEVAKKFEELNIKNKWSADGKTFSNFPQLKPLPKQYVPTIDGNRINHVLKNNYHSGSYCLEFFDESKNNVAFLLGMDNVKKLNHICEKIKLLVPIDLAIVRDRIGNFIFQFPISILETNYSALPSLNGLSLSFVWHKSLKALPDCLIQVDTMMDKNFMGSAIQDYDKADTQEIITGSLDQTNQVKIWRKDPSLILYANSGSFATDIILDIGITSHEPRIFEVDGKLKKIPVTSFEHRDGKDSNYTTYISNSLYDSEKKQLETSLSFKQYNKGREGGIEDLQRLIQQKDQNGVYLWDPFLRPQDILQTLYYSKRAGVPLRAIGSINSMVKLIYEKKGETAEDIIAAYKTVFENPKNNNHLLNLDFRIQHSDIGWAFHDRFLIFPGSVSSKPQAYSLGTSLNSYGNNHHILQEVSHPQRVVDAFDELWNELDHTKCLVWKHGK